MSDINWEYYRCKTCGCGIEFHQVIETHTMVTTADLTCLACIVDCDDSVLWKELY